MAIIEDSLVAPAVNLGLYFFVVASVRRPARVLDRVIKHGFDF